MTSFQVDWSRPLFSQRGQEQKLLPWTEDYYFVFCVSSSKRNAICMESNETDDISCVTRYWRCVDKRCKARAKCSILENGEEGDFIVSTNHFGQILMDGMACIDRDSACGGLLARDEYLWKTFQVQAREYALNTDPRSGVVLGKTPSQVVMEIRNVALAHPVLCADIWLSGLYTTKQITDIRSNVNKRSDSSLIPPRTNLEIWTNLPVNHPHRFFRSARNDGIVGLELFLQRFHDFQSPVVIHRIVQPCIMYYFYLDSGLRTLGNSSTWYVDATFKVVPAILQSRNSGFAYQLVNIFALEKNCLIPLFHALMPGKKELYYQIMFEFIRNEFQARESTAVMEVRNVVVDFEKALHNGLRRAFGANTSVNGCYFHFTQAIMRKIRQIPSLRVAYSCNIKAANVLDRDPFHLFVRQIFALPLIPAQYVASCFLKTVEEFFSIADLTFLLSRELQGFMGYLHNTWFSSPQQIQLWNASDLHRDTGNCAAENFHGRLRRILNDHPNVWDFLSKFAAFHGTEYYTVTAQARAGTLTRARPSKAERDCRNIILDQQLKLRNGVISEMTALVNIRNAKLYGDTENVLSPLNMDEQEQFAVDTSNEEEGIMYNPELAVVENQNIRRDANPFMNGRFSIVPVTASISTASAAVPSSVSSTTEVVGHLTASVQDSSSAASIVPINTTGGSSSVLSAGDRSGTRNSTRSGRGQNSRSHGRGRGRGGVMNPGGVAITGNNIQAAVEAIVASPSLTFSAPPTTIGSGNNFAASYDGIVEDATEISIAIHSSSSSSPNAADVISVDGPAGNTVNAIDVDTVYVDVIDADEFDSATHMETSIDHAATTNFEVTGLTNIDDVAVASGVVAETDSVERGAYANIASRWVPQEDSLISIKLNGVTVTKFLNAVVREFLNWCDKCVEEERRRHNKSGDWVEISSSTASRKNQINQLFDYLKHANEDSIRRGLVINFSDSIGIDVGGIWRSFTNEISGDIVNHRFSDDVSDASAGQAYFLSCEREASGMSIPNVEIVDPDAREFYSSFGKYLAAVLLHNGQFPTWLHLGVIKFVMGQDFSFKEDILPHFTLSQEQQILAIVKDFPEDTSASDLAPFRAAFLAVSVDVEFTAATAVMQSQSSAKMFQKYEPLLAKEYFQFRAGRNALEVIKDGFSSICFPSLIQREIGHNQLSIVIEAYWPKKPLSREKLLSAFLGHHRHFSDNLAEDNFPDSELAFENVPFLEHCSFIAVHALDDDNLRSMVTLISGTKACPAPRSIQLRMVLDSENKLPVAHTCFNYLEIFAARYLQLYRQAKDEGLAGDGDEKSRVEFVSSMILQDFLFVIEQWLGAPTSFEIS